MTKVFTRLQLKQILKQNLTNKILESKKSTPIQKRILPGIKILNIFYEKINWKLIFFLSTHGENLLKAPKRHKNFVDIFFRGSNKFHKIHAYVMKFIGDMLKMQPNFLILVKEIFI